MYYFNCHTTCPCYLRETEKTLRQQLVAGRRQATRLELALTALRRRACDAHRLLHLRAQHPVLDVVVAVQNNERTCIHYINAFVLKTLPTLISLPEKSVDQLVGAAARTGCHPLGGVLHHCAHQSRSAHRRIDVVALQQLIDTGQQLGDALRAERV